MQHGTTNFEAMMNLVRSSIGNTSLKFNSDQDCEEGECLVSSSSTRSSLFGDDEVLLMQARQRIRERFRRHQLRCIFDKDQSHEHDQHTICNQEEVQDDEDEEGIISLEAFTISDDEDCYSDANDTEVYDDNQESHQLDDNGNDSGDEEIDNNSDAGAATNDEEILTIDHYASNSEEEDNIADSIAPELISLDPPISTIWENFDNSIATTARPLDFLLDTNESFINLEQGEELLKNLSCHLTWLGFDTQVTDIALRETLEEYEEEGDIEIDEVDVFISLIKAVSDAHYHHMLGENDDTLNRIQTNSSNVDTSTSSMATKAAIGIFPNIDHNAATFPWPVFDMAQYEFGLGRPGTCFDSVVVIVNLPLISGKRYAEFRDLVLVHIFSMLSDPIQVALPQLYATGVTKGHAFLEFQNFESAYLAAQAINGMQWGFHAESHIRAMLFRQYRGVDTYTHETNRDNIELNATSTNASGLSSLSGLTFQELHPSMSHHNTIDSRNRFDEINQSNDRLQYLVHCVERDRDAVMMENEQLKLVVEKYRLREQEHDNLLERMSFLRQQMKKNEIKYQERIMKMKKNEIIVDRLRLRLHHLTGHALHALTLAEIRDLEETVENAMHNIRHMKEQKIMEQNTILNRQVESEAKQCVICLSNEKTILCLPCRHLCMCQTCASHKEVTRCPICRLQIEETMIVYS